MHEVSETGAARLALETFSRLQEAVELRTIANRPGSLGRDFEALGPLTILQSGTIARMTGRLARSTQARQTIEGVIGQARSRTFIPWSPSWRPDVVYLNSAAALPILSRLPWVRLLRLPTVLHVHEGETLLRRIEEIAPGMIGAVPDAYVAVSEFVATSLVEGFGVPQTNVVVVPPAIDERWLAYAARERDHGVSAEAYLTVGGAGVPAWTKGIDLWVLTAAELVRRHGRDRFRFIWYGIDREKTASLDFATMIAKLGLGDLVRLEPHVPDPLPHFSGLDVMLVSSWEDSASLVALEAMALGKVVACFRGSGGPPELVDQAGVVVDSFSPTDMADAIEGLVDPAVRQSLGDLAKRLVAERNDPHRQAPKVLGIIRSVAGARARGKRPFIRAR
jgi:glycosyltransferase involved in cell wall biosynthesis